MLFTTIWNNHRSHLLHFIRSKVDEEHIADDILQEVSIKLHDNLNRGTKINNYKTWLFQVTRNTIADYYRKSKKSSNLLRKELKTESGSEACVCDLSGFVIQTYLPQEYSNPLYLSDIEKRPQQEIAEILNLSLTATKSRIQRGRVKLKELVNECIDIEFNNKGQIVDFQLKPSCELPQELISEMERINLVL